ncbi:MAG TPA: hypothetical protein VF202_06440 [Trueperaceae bacterium]|jgi:hypothetical protein
MNWPALDRPATRTVRRALASLALVVAASTASAQVSVGATIPEAASLTISHDQVVFDLSQAVYPPARFPAYYLPTDPDPATDPMSFTVFTNVSGWTIVVTFSGLYNEQENVILPADQLEYSLDGVTWHAFAPGSNRIVVGRGPTAVQETYRFAVRLRIDGTEPPGRYVGSLTFSLNSD